MSLFDRPEKPGTSRTKVAVVTGGALLILRGLDAQFGWGLSGDLLEGLAAVAGLAALHFLRDAMPRRQAPPLVGRNGGGL